MVLKEIAARVGAKVYIDGGKESEGFYCGDFLSRVMSKAPAGCCWLTVINNINVAGVCVMADIYTVILCEGVIPDPALVEKCKIESVSLLATDLPIFECVKRLLAGT